MIKALIIDLDNTLFPTKNITDEIYAGIYEMMAKDHFNHKDIEAVKVDLIRMPFQKVADKYGFSADLRKQGVELLKATTYNKLIKPYKDYNLVQALKLPKFLVTAGFTRLQQSKIDCLGVRSHFKEVTVVDPEVTQETKCDVFLRIMQNYGYKKGELIAIGDDPQSEIEAARSIGIPTYLYDPESKVKSNGVTWHEQHYDRLKQYLERGL